MNSHYHDVVRLSGKVVPALLAEQDLDPGSRDYGGYVPVDRGYSEPGQSAFAVSILTALFCCPDSKWFGSGELSARALLYCDHLLSAQHDDGTVDLRETNFHDATMVAFSVQKLAYTYRLLLSQSPDSARSGPLADSILTFLSRGAAGMVNGGFHTPNHRWVLASGLALLSNILADDSLRAEAECYLREGVDCTAAGEYTERSAGIYNAVNNRSLMIIAGELERPDLLDHVRRNLDMMLNYFEPDGSVFTLNSQRQDAGRVTYPVNYYENYLLMAHHDDNPVYAGVADSLLNLAIDGRGRPEEFGPVLTHFLLDKTIREQSLTRQEPPASYVFENRDSGIVRMRSGNVGVSLLAGHSIFLQFRAGGLAVGVKIAGTFYGPRGRFLPGAIQKTDHGYRLESVARRGYVRPLPTAPSTTDWDNLPHDQREHVMVSDFAVRVDVQYADDSAELNVAVTGTDGVLTKVEFLFTPGGWFDTEDARVPGDAGHTVVLKKGTAIYRLGLDAIAIDGGFAEHNFTTTMRGSDPQLTDVFTAYCTGYTPIERSIRLRSVTRAV